MEFVLPKRQKNMFIKIVSTILSITFISTTAVPPSYAQVMNLPQPGSMVGLTPAFMPTLIKGLKVHPENPLLFDFILDTGKSGIAVNTPEFKAESEKLIKYFLASMTIKESDLWVNLSPYEKNRIATDELGKTELGRDMLAQDYILKQLTASLMYPEKEIGKDFWNKVYAEAKQKFGTTDIPTDTFNKVWIVADKATVFEREVAVPTPGGSGLRALKEPVAYVVGAHLKVMLEEDYVAASKASSGHSTISPLSSPQSLSGDPAVDSRLRGNDRISSVIRQIILPAIEKEVNEGKNFATLRQMFYSMILATWYKQALKDALLNQVYSDKAKIGGVTNNDPAIKEKIYAQYLEAFKKGAYNYIKEEYDPATQQVTPKKYFSGGLEIGVGKVLARQAIQTPETDSAMAPNGDMAMVSTRLATTLAAIGLGATLLVGGFYYHGATQSQIWEKSKSKADIVSIEKYHQQRDRMGLKVISKKAEARYQKIIREIQRAREQKAKTVGNETNDKIALAEKYSVFDQFTETYADLAENDVDDNPAQRMGGNVPSAWKTRLGSQERDAVETGREGILALTLNNLSNEIGIQLRLINVEKKHINQFKKVAPTFFKGEMGTDIGKVDSSLTNYFVNENTTETQMLNDYTFRQRDRVNKMLYKTNASYHWHSDHFSGLSNFHQKKLSPAIQSADKIVKYIKSMQSNKSLETMNLGLATMHMADVEMETDQDGHMTTKIVNNSGPYLALAATFAAAASVDAHNANKEAARLKNLLPLFMNDPLFQQENLQGPFANLNWKDQASGILHPILDFVLPPTFSLIGNIFSDNGSTGLQTIEPVRQALHTSEASITPRINVEHKWIDGQIDTEISRQIEEEKAVSLFGNDYAMTTSDLETFVGTVNNLPDSVKQKIGTNINIFLKGKSGVRTDKAMMSAIKETIDDLQKRLPSEEQLNILVQQHQITESQRADYKKLIQLIEQLSKVDEEKIWESIESKGYTRADFEALVKDLGSVIANYEPKGLGIKDIRKYKTQLSNNMLFSLTVILIMYVSLVSPAIQYDFKGFWMISGSLGLVVTLINAGLVIKNVRKWFFIDKLSSDDQAMTTVLSPDMDFTTARQEFFTALEKKFVPELNRKAAYELLTDLRSYLLEHQASPSLIPLMDGIHADLTKRYTDINEGRFGKFDTDIQHTKSADMVMQMVGELIGMQVVLAHNRERLSSNRGLAEQIGQELIKELPAENPLKSAIDNKEFTEEEAVSALRDVFISRARLVDQTASIKELPASVQALAWLKNPDSRPDTIRLNTLKGKTILVTGGSGYVSAGVIHDILAQGAKAIIYDNSIRDREEMGKLPGVTVIDGGIDNQAKMEQIMRDNKVDAVVHLGGYIAAGESMKFPAKYFNNNIRNTVTLLAAMSNTNVKNLVFASSAGVYSGKEFNKDGVLDETMRPDPQNAYGTTKYGMEMMMREYSEKLGIKMVALRFFNVAGAFKWGNTWYGENHEGPETHLIPRVMKAFLYPDKIQFKIFGTDYDTVDGTAVRDYIQVQDLADAHMRALAHLFDNGTNKILNLGTGEGYSVKEVVTQIQALIKKETGKDFQVGVAGRRAGDPAELKASGKKAFGELHWKAAHGLESTIASAWAFHIQEKALGRLNHDALAPESKLPQSEVEFMDGFLKELSSNTVISSDIKLEFFFRLFAYSLNAEFKGGERKYISDEDAIYQRAGEIQSDKRGVVPTLAVDQDFRNQLAAYQEKIKSEQSPIYQQRSAYLSTIFELLKNTDKAMATAQTKDVSDATIETAVETIKKDFFAKANLTPKEKDFFKIYFISEFTTALKVAVKKGIFTSNFVNVSVGKYYTADLSYADAAKIIAIKLREGFGEHNINKEIFVSTYQLLSDIDKAMTTGMSDEMKKQVDALDDPRAKKALTLVFTNAIEWADAFKRHALTEMRNRKINLEWVYGPYVNYVNLVQTPLSISEIEDMATNYVYRKDKAMMSDDDPWYYGPEADSSNYLSNDEFYGDKPPDTLYHSTESLDDFFQKPFEVERKRAARLIAVKEMEQKRSLIPILGYAAIDLYNQATESNVSSQEFSTEPNVQFKVLAWVKEKYNLKSLPMAMDLTLEHESIILNNVTDEGRVTLQKDEEKNIRFINGKETLIDFKGSGRPELNLTLKRAGIDWNKLKPFDPKQAARFQVAAAALAKFKEKFPTSPTMAFAISPYTLVSHLLGDEAFVGLLSDTDEFKAVFAYAKQYIKDYVKYMAEVGKADSVMFLDPVPTGTMSPDMFESYAVEPINEIADYARSLGLVVGAHPCRPQNDAMAKQLLPKFAQYKVDLLSIDSIYNLREVYDYIQANVPEKDRPVLIGNVDTIETLPQGSPEKVTSEVSQIFKTMGNAPFILCSSCDILSITKENMTALYQTAKKEAEPFDKAMSVATSETREIKLENDLGMHFKPANAISRAAETFYKQGIVVIIEKDDDMVRLDNSNMNVMRLLSLGISQIKPVKVTIESEDFLSSEEIDFVFAMLKELFQSKQLLEAPEHGNDASAAYSAKINRFFEQQKRNELDEAMTTKAPGGIDLNAKNLKMDVSKDGKGVEFKFDPAMVAEFQKGNFTGVVPVIIRITPIESPFPLLGLEVPTEQAIEITKKS
ncbi:MAG: UDP-glucose 4-epimerase GalE [Candidatus Omnitrophica bacterium]|nr:UDP-glucose 4-epimerase GalE [Candidatus Omnitrophota bacterium]